jgi:hypothetical protein
LEVYVTVSLVLKAYVALLRTDRYLARSDFAGLYGMVRNCALGEKAPPPGTTDDICSAIDMACVWYRNEVLCLQRSAATTCLLRRYGIPAEMVIGAEMIPFKAHAWVEVSGRVVNDKPYTPEMYTVLDRC